MKKIVNGMVAVLVSQGFGAGWSTWNHAFGEELLFDPGLVDLIESNATPDKLLAYATLKWPDAYLGGLEDLRIEWLPVGSKFVINEYDGSETIQTLTETNWVTA